MHTLKPGYLVSAKVVKLFENGLEVSFLGGMRGTIFADHSNRDKIKQFKTGEKMQARVISQDVAGKRTTLSLLPSLMSLS
jgi:ribosomal protein S1